MNIAEKMQDWVREQIEARLEERLDDKAFGKLEISSVGKQYAGGWRSVSVDVHVRTEKTGLLLAADPKHLQSGKSIAKNWKNMLNDILAFAGNLHTRYPMAVVGAALGFSEAQAEESTLKEMYSIFERVATRTLPSDVATNLEGFAIMVYECDPPRLSPSIPPTGNPFRFDTAFDRMASLFVQRFVP